MSRKLDDLSSRMKVKAFELLARAAEQGIPVLVVDTLRTIEEQQHNLECGVSWTLASKHLPQPPENKSEAIDICPYHIFDLHGPDKLAWNADEPAWQTLGEIGESLGLRWGGRWVRKDLGHFEYRDMIG